MTDLLAQFELEQEAERERERTILNELGGAGDSTTYFSSARTIRPGSAARTSRSTHTTTSSSSSLATAAIGAETTVAGESLVSRATAALREDEFELRPLLWRTITELTPISEHAALRHMLGEKQLEKNELLDQEIRTLLTIVTGQQIQNARRKNEKLKQQQQQSKSSSSNSPSPTLARPLSRAALPASGVHRFLSTQIQEKLVGLRASAVGSGILKSNELDLTRVLPRPNTARQRRVMEEIVQQTFQNEPRPTSAKDSIHDIAPATSRPTSQPGSIRPSTARLRSSSSCSSVSSISPETSARSNPSTTAAAITSLSSTLINTSNDANNPGSDSDRTLITTIQRSLKEEEQDLLQDIAYLNQCLESEISDTVQLELESKNTAASSTASSTTHSSPSQPDLDAPITIHELREFNEQLKEAETLEHQRSQMLKQMASIETRQATSGTMNGIIPNRSTGGLGASASRGAPSPLKAVRIPSLNLTAATLRPGSGSTSNSGAASPGLIQSRPTSAVQPSPNHSPLSSPITTSLRSSDGLTSLEELMSTHADFFGDGPTTNRAPTVTSPSSTVPTRPSIPTLPIASLSSTGGTAAHAHPSTELKHDSDLDRVSAVASHPPLTPTRPSSSGPSGAPSSSPLTARSSSKLRSRLEHAQLHASTSTTTVASTSATSNRLN